MWIMFFSPYFHVTDKGKAIFLTCSPGITVTIEMCLFHIISLCFFLLTVHPKTAVVNLTGIECLGREAAVSLSQT